MNKRGSGAKRAGGMIFIISAPSGTGKSTICKELLRKIPQLKFSVSYTTRPAREGEVDSVDYFFIDDDKFNEMVRAKEFLEWAEVYDCKYGTSKKLTEEALNRGDSLLLEIDIQGARKVKSIYPDSVAIFVLPPSISELERRLANRTGGSLVDMEKRLKLASEEIRGCTFYDYIVINDELDSAVEKIKSIIIAEKHRQKRMRGLISSRFAKEPCLQGHTKE